MSGDRIKIKRAVGLLILLVIISTSISALAHVPKQAEGNEHYDHAMHIHDPLKSWVIYSSMEEGVRTHYYEMDLEEGDRLRTMLFVPEKTDFVPGIILMGPGMGSSSQVPSYVENPENQSVSVHEGELHGAEYEPFTPAAHYGVVDIDIDVEESGTYYLVIYEPEGQGEYGLAIGYEERYGLFEWIRVPIDVIDTHLWEGQDPLLIFSPMIVTFLIGSFSIYKYREEHPMETSSSYRKIHDTLTVGVSFLFIGSGAMIFYQLLYAAVKATPGPGVILTIVFGSVPIILGISILRIVLKGGKYYLSERIRLMAYCVLGLFFWAGLIVGPILGMVVESVFTAREKF